MKVGDCMPFDATCPRALPYPDVVTSVPFTFRDGLTTLELIERLRHYICHIQKDMNEITRQLLDDIKANRDSIDALLEQYQEDYKSTIERWLGDNLPQYVYDYITKSVQTVFFGLTDDGYFCAYIPKKWAQYIEFDTGANYNDDQYGCLILRY